MANQGYTKVVQYHFEVEGELLAITDADKYYVRVKKIQNNGQEDTHMVGVLCVTMNNKFVWESGRHLFVEHGSESLADGIQKHLNTYGFPGRRKSG